MSNINIPAVASGAFLGFMALAALIWCFPPITRFLGDLCCCPWSIPFIRKKRRNGDEEMDKDDLLYVTDEPHADTPVDTAGYQRVSAAYISAISVVDPETATKEARRSAEYYRRDHLPQGDLHRRDHSPISKHNGEDQHDHDVHHEGAYYGSYLQVPQPDMAHPADWRQPYLKRHLNYPVQGPCEDEHSSYSGYGYDAGYPNVQPPEPSYPPPEISAYQHADGYLPATDHFRPDYAMQHHSDKSVAVPK